MTVYTLWSTHRGRRSPHHRSRQRVSRGLLVVVGVLCAMLVGACPAAGYWAVMGAGSAAAATGTLTAPTAVTVPDISNSTVTVSWTAAAGSPQPTGYYVTRTGATTSAACGSSPNAVIPGTSCVDAGIPDGTYTYRVTAVYRSWTAASAASNTVLVATPVSLQFSTQPSTTVAGNVIGPPVAVTLRTAGGSTAPIGAVQVRVAIGSNPGTGALSGTLTAFTNASGVATFADLSIEKIGAGYTLTAASVGLTSATSSTFTVTPAAATQVVFTSPPVSGAASSSASLGPFTVQLRDTFGNPTPAPTGGTTILLGSSSTGTRVFALTLSGTAVTNVSVPAGSYTGSFYYGDTKAGTPTITASSAGLGSGTQTATITAAAAAKLVYDQQPTNTKKNRTIAPPITVLIQDEFGNQTSSTALVLITILNNPGPGVLRGTISESAVAGVATFEDLSIGPKKGDGYTLQVASGVLTGAISMKFDIT